MQPNPNKPKPELNGTKSNLDKALEKMIGQKTNQSCPDCGGYLVIRKNKINNSFFLGCNRYPNCRGTADIPEAMKLKLLGHKTLPGFE